MLDAGLTPGISVRRGAPLKLIPVEVPKEGGRSWAGAGDWPPEQTAMLGVNDPSCISLGPFPLRIRQDRIAARMEKEMHIPVAPPAGGRVGRPVGELHERPAVSERLLEAIDPAGPTSRLGYGPTVAQQLGVVDAQAFRTETAGWRIGNAGQIAVVRQQTAVATIQPVAPVIDE